ncbi:MAG TPA: hypothetical protein VGM11_08165 [Acidobacteriaceae bacterium]|jgi:Tfp pilus assembly protein PilF
MSEQVLQGWSAIAVFLSCDERTAKRWETERELPVHRTRRTPGNGRANVYAVVSELEQWRAAAQAASISPPARPANIAASSAVDDPIEVPADTKNSSSRRWFLSGAIFAVICIVVATAAMLWARQRGVEHAVDDPANHSIVTETAGAARAHELYLHGLYLFEQRRPETLTQAEADFEQAIAADQSYAPAYAGLAKTYELLREYSTMPSQQAYPLAKQAALRAIALDPKLPDAHAALAFEEFFWEWKSAEAEREFKQAIALDANSSVAHQWYGSMLMHQARFAEALHELDRAQVLEPASAGVLGIRAAAMGLSGRRDDAVELLQDALARGPDSAPLHFILAQLCLQEPRDIPRYLDHMQRFARLRHSDEDARLLDAAARVYRREGEPAMWKAMLAADQRAGRPTYMSAQIETVLGMKDAALSDLENLERAHDENLIGLDIDPLLEPLRGDPRFAQLVAKVGLPGRPAKQV